MVDVAGHRITAGTVDHWMALTAVRNYELYPQRAVPPGALPDPPAYRRCIAFLRETVPADRSSSVTASSLKTQCRQKEEALHSQVVSQLITGYWFIAAAREAGIHLTSAEVQARYRHATQDQFHTAKAFEVFLARTGETVADQHFRAEIKLSSEKLEARILALPLSKRGPALLRFVTEFPPKWAARTTCAPGYVVPNCREYRGKTPPRAELP